MHVYNVYNNRIPLINSQNKSKSKNNNNNNRTLRKASFLAYTYKSNLYPIQSPNWCCRVWSRESSPNGPLFQTITSHHNHSTLLQPLFLNILGLSLSGEQSGSSPKRTLYLAGKLHAMGPRSVHSEVETGQSQAATGSRGVWPHTLGDSSWNYHSKAQLHNRFSATNKNTPTRES